MEVSVLYSYPFNGASFLVAVSIVLSARINGHPLGVALGAVLLF